jgi:hypothetical protein
VSEGTENTTTTRDGGVDRRAIGARTDLLTRRVTTTTTTTAAAAAATTIAANSSGSGELYIIPVTCGRSDDITCGLGVIRPMPNTSNARQRRRRPALRSFGTGQTTSST